MKKLENNEKILIAFLCVCLIVVIASKIIFSQPKKNQIDTSIKIVTDQNRFFEVASCINKYISYSQNDEYDKLLSIINDKYKKENNITADNVYTYLHHFGLYDVFSARKMYYQQLDDGVYKYYVYGYYRQELMSGIGNSYDYYVVVYLYTSNMTFSIEPYDGKVFEG